MEMLYWRVFVYNFPMVVARSHYHTVTKTFKFDWIVNTIDYESDNNFPQVVTTFIINLNYS